jgi:8-oxo-dGTP diphosphatase
MAGKSDVKITVDTVVFHHQADTNDLSLLLVRRGSEPFKGMWGLPGGFVEEGEPLEDAARRELEEETGLKVDDIRQFYTFGDPDRDPRFRSVSVAHFAMLKPGSPPAKAGSDASEVKWFSTTELPELAFDHSKIIDMAIQMVDTGVK